MSVNDKDLEVVKKVREISDSPLMRALAGLVQDYWPNRPHDTGLVLGYAYASGLATGEEL